jgi:uncharacterized protein (TIGR02217 family)
MPSLFHEVRLPEDIERGATGGPMFKTTVLQLDSGLEQRNIDWSQPKHSWDISYGLMSLKDNDLETYVEVVRDFFYARRGRAYGFRFKDWSDFEIGDWEHPTTTNQAIGLGDDVTTVFQVYKRYSSGGVDFDRTIRKLVNGTVKVLIDGVVQVGGYTVDNNTGLITFSSAPASTGGTGDGDEQVVSVACEFDVPVRFDDDHFKINLQNAMAGSIESMTITSYKLRT